MASEQLVPVARPEQTLPAALDGQDGEFGLGIAQFLDIAWRTVATGLCFAVFGVGQLVLALTVFPLLMFFRNPERRRQLGRKVVHHAFRGFIQLMRLTGVLEYRVEGLELLRQPGTIVLANHPSLIDVVFLISLIPEADCVVKASLLRNPFTRYAILAAGYVPNHADPEAVLAGCRASLDAGGILVVFPEGTRSEPGKLSRFQRGAAQIALRARCDMVPVVIRTGAHNLGRGSRWWRVPARKVPFLFQVKQRLAVDAWLPSGQEPAIAARELTDFLSTYFRTEIGAPCPSWWKNSNN